MSVRLIHSGLRVAPTAQRGGKTARPTLPALVTQNLPRHPIVYLGIGGEWGGYSGGDGGVLLTCGHGAARRALLLASTDCYCPNQVFHIDFSGDAKGRNAL
ncbi:hypothetical protein O3P69_003133 [Scylla paramamosain]|uniref:Uncharacterized protein n=1 Tax=Scylla paramamosain TaxID=85552 RepID=A0AAW0UPV1_SCYPA